MPDFQQEWIALLGRRDEPVDGVEDYCTFLGAALARRDIQFEHVRADWFSEGWVATLRKLWKQRTRWRGKWVILQYTALGWSRRGFPFPAIAVLEVFRRGGAKTAVVFHEPYRQKTHSPGWISRIRGACQDWVIHKLYERANKCIFADPLERIRWLPRNHSKAVFIPIGANIPEPAPQSETYATPDRKVKTVAVFCLTEMPKRKDELGDISHAVRYASNRGRHLRVVFCGRGTPEAKDDIERAFSDTPVEASIEGLVDSRRITEILAASDAMLCVRGEANHRRGSVIAGIACGLPIVGYGGEAEGTPLADAGLELVAYRDRDALGAALLHVLSDDGFSETLRVRSLRSQRECFSWDRIADAFIAALG